MKNILQQEIVVNYAITVLKNQKRMLLKGGRKMENQLEQNLRKTHGNYVIPKKIAVSMKNISPRTQYEAAMLSMIFIILGLIVMAIYMPFQQGLSLFLKIFLPFNSLCGVFLLSSFLVTTFQQYQSYLAVMGLMEERDKE